MYRTLLELKIAMGDIRKDYIKESSKWRFYQRYHKLR